MRTFDYHRPKSVPETVALLASGSETRPIAGGMSLLPTMKQRLAAPGALIDLSAIAALKGISANADTITIGAMTRHFDVASSPAITKTLPALAALAGSIGDPAVRNRGTVGGSLANNDPAADYPAAVLALGATVLTNQRRHLEADGFFRGMFETALVPGEIITAVVFPKPIAAGYAKMRRTSPRASRWWALFTAKFPTGVRVAVTGAGPAVFRVPTFEAALNGALPDLGAPCFAERRCR